MSVDLKYDVLCCECLCMAYPLESGEVMAGSLHKWEEQHVSTLHREYYHTFG